MNYIFTATRNYAGHFQSVNIRLYNGNGNMFPTLRTWALLLSNFDYNYGGESIVGSNYKSQNYVASESEINISDGTITGDVSVVICWGEESSVNQDSPRTTIIKIKDVSYNNVVSRILDEFREVTGKIFEQNKKFYISCMNVRLFVN